MAGKTHLSLIATPGKARTFSAATPFVRDYTKDVRIINPMDFGFVATVNGGFNFTTNNMSFTFTADVVYKG